VSQAGLVGGGELGEVPYLRPHPGVAPLFARRAARLADLAGGHAAGDYLHLLSRLAEAQRSAAERLGTAQPIVASPAGPPLAGAGPWHAAWRPSLRTILLSLRGEDSPPVREALDRLAVADQAALEPMAGRLLAGEVPASEVATAPFLGAALQVALTWGAAAVLPEQVDRAEAGCPLCGAAPVVGLVLGDDRLRYLVCGLCATAWHHTRVQCVVCRSGAALSYLVVEGDAGPAKAEACQDCQAYLKLLYVEKAPALEPLADDVATLRLDLLMAERGLRRLGRNPLLVHAEAEPDSPST
jgi:FdhE protein